MTKAAVVAYVLPSVLIVVSHLSAWLAAGPGDRGLGDPNGFSLVNWGLTTFLLGIAWVALLVVASWLSWDRDDRDRSLPYRSLRSLLAHPKS